MRSFLFAAMAVALACGGSEAPAPGGDASSPSDAEARDGGDSGVCPTIRSYCSVDPLPPECSGQAAKINELCTTAPMNLIHLSNTSCAGIVAVYEQGVDTATFFYFDAVGNLVGVAHTGIGGTTCSAGGGAFVPPGANGSGCVVQGNTKLVCVDGG